MQRAKQFSTNCSTQINFSHNERRVLLLSQFYFIFFCSFLLLLLLGGPRYVCSWSVIYALRVSLRTEPAICYKQSTSKWKWNSRVMERMRERERGRKFCTVGRVWKVSCALKFALDVLKSLYLQFRQIHLVENLKDELIYQINKIYKQFELICCYKIC